MKPWKPCEHCYLKDKYCENAEREQPCVPVQEYLERGYEIKRLQKKLEIATKALKKALKDYEINGPCEEDCVGYYMSFIIRRALKEMEEV